MKSFFISIYFVLSLFHTPILQETRKTTATFDGYVNNQFKFTNSEGNSFTFHSISDTAKNTFDLTQDKFKGVLFYISFEMIQTQDKTSPKYTIVGLKKLE
ncbi:hypothetical protein [Maribacter sp. 2304DJ31-5]|uniref:hypothetical protein n=1 Tax=Maribacter sp. 2304DJ31-5 TaxID=3386273 RepID=UPI0039BD04B6